MADDPGARCTAVAAAKDIIIAWMANENVSIPIDQLQQHTTEMVVAIINAVRST